MIRIKSPSLVLMLLCTAFLGTTFAKSSSSVTLASSLNPSTFGTTVTFTATVTPSNATGPVTFTDGSTTLGTGSISSGVASYTTSALVAGTHSIVASYGGNSSYFGSTSSALTQTVSQKATSVLLSSNDNPSSYASVVTFTATVSPALATGTVTFFDGSTALGTGTISGGTVSSPWCKSGFVSKKFWSIHRFYS